MNENNILVHFVGAGPGAEDLITVRAVNLLKNADIVIYAGSLINPGILKYAENIGQDNIYNSAYMTLEQVIQVIKEGAKSNKQIVRLHTGEPSIYGAVKEQMRKLDELGIGYDSCPGVSACFGAAASLNLEYTLPGVSQSLIITRMAGKTEVPEKESIESFAAHKASMAIYLSVSMAKELSDRLIEGGYSGDTPAAIIYKATWPEEKIVKGKVCDLHKMAEDNGITKTALILVGDVIGAEDYDRSRLYAPDFSTEFRKADTGGNS